MLKPWSQRGLKYALSSLLIVILCVVVSELLGWPFLAHPIEHQLSKLLNRQVSISRAEFKIRFLGGARIQISNLLVAAPSWSKKQFTIEAKNLDLSLRYSDVWAAYRGDSLTVARLSADRLNSNLERLADGRETWQFRESPAPQALIPNPSSNLIPNFNSLEITDGILTYSDEKLRLSLETKITAGAENKTVTANGTGQYRGFPLKFQLTSSNTLPWESSQPGKPRIGLIAQATLGRAILKFNGSISDANSLNDVMGNYTLSGPSLAAVGDPVGVTLPTTSAFNATGTLAKKRDDWSVIVRELYIGSSRLNGAFKFAKEYGKNKLSGRLNGAKLKLTDLGPAIGRNIADKERKTKGKVLPTRPFDLAALRVMDANVLIDIHEVDLNTSLLEPLKPLRGHLQLIAGVLTISAIQAETAKGSISGTLKLDGRSDQALWTVDMRWDGIRLEQWLKLATRNGLPPYISGQLNGTTLLNGEGKSTAEILASLKGSAKTQLKNGSVSHLLIEAAGLDLAQALGVLIKGDDSLTISCAMADLTVSKGVFKPKVLVVDTKDSAVWIDGSLSLATELLDLKTIVAPKDFSLLTFRSPILVKGSFSEPKVSIEKGPLGMKLGAALILGLINPIAAMIPFIDTGDRQKAAKATQECAELAKKSLANLRARKR
jgi:AsmA family protein